jgi:WD40 repeat protein
VTKEKAYCFAPNILFQGILLGHKRGVRCLSHYDTTLLSAGFECEARTWDMATKEPVAILKGHRLPVAAARLMCDRAQSEKEYRAVGKGW